MKLLESSCERHCGALLLLVINLIPQQFGWAAFLLRRIVFAFLDGSDPSYPDSTPRAAGPFLIQTSARFMTTLSTDRQFFLIDQQLLRFIPQQVEWAPFLLRRIVFTFLDGRDGADPHRLCAGM